MKKVKYLKALIALGIVAACGCMLTACSGGSDASGNASAGSGAVAATVNGVEILESKITDQVQAVRQAYAMEDDEAWAKYLIDGDTTPEDVRKNIIDSFVDQELVKVGIEDLGLTVEDSEIDSYVESMRSNFDSDEAWADALEQAGFTEESYRENIKNSLLQQKLNEHFESEAKVEDKDMLESANSIASYYDGAKRSSYILFAVEDAGDEQAVADAKTRAQAVLDEVKAGADFAEKAKATSEDEATAANGGDAGWDVNNYIGEEYSAALGELSEGQVSDPVESDAGVYLIKCTEVFVAPEKLTKLDQLPEEFRESIEQMAKSNKVQSDYNAWLEGLREAAEIVINDMPADVPYNIDLTAYQSASSEAADTADGEADSGSSADAEGEGAEEIVVEEVDETSADAEEVVTEEDVELEQVEKDEAKSK
ncbi:MAG: SurA N-terminal domain-containing protein [Eggerthellaceae bacterium]|nr:SurA N-terminal domain-containing protein [Eggerthellaceae bacterium]